jgi:prepilin-type N-terminal cleavage/methylation domain-containing protein
MKIYPRPILNHKHGFTLIELSIVLVIIGLIVGGVWVGKDMIKASEIRSTAKQYEQFQTAVNTFRNKYDGLPGDLLASKASAFALCPTIGCMSGAAGLGDQNGLIGNGGPAESLAAWNQLYWADLINGDFGSAAFVSSAMTFLSSQGSTTTQGDDATLRRYFPPAKLGGLKYWNMTSSNSGNLNNYYVLGGFSQFFLLPPMITSEAKSRSLTPTEAFQLDSKLDDGKPRTGKVLAKAEAVFVIPPSGVADDTRTTSAAWSTATAANAIAGDCITGGTNAADTANIYATAASASANTPACLLRLAF